MRFSRKFSLFVTEWFLYFIFSTLISFSLFPAYLRIIIMHRVTGSLAFSQRITYCIAMGLLYCVSNSLIAICCMIFELSTRWNLFLPCLVCCLGDAPTWAQWGKSSDGIHFKSSRFQGVGRVFLPSHVSISSHTNGSLKSRQIYTIFFSTVFLPVPMPPVAWFFLFFLSRFTRNLFQLRRNSSSSFKWSIDFRIATIWCIYSFKALFK